MSRESKTLRSHSKYINVPFCHACPRKSDFSRRSDGGKRKLSIDTRTLVFLVPTRIVLVTVTFPSGTWYEKTVTCGSGGKGAPVSGEMIKPRDKAQFTFTRHARCAYGYGRSPKHAAGALTRVRATMMLRTSHASAKLSGNRRSKRTRFTSETQWGRRLVKRSVYVREQSSDVDGFCVFFGEFTRRRRCPRLKYISMTIYFAFYCLYYVRFRVTFKTFWSCFFFSIGYFSVFHRLKKIKSWDLNFLLRKKIVTKTI